jgi:hypothetical protein
MKTRASADGSSAQILDAADPVISDALKEDPKGVARALTAIVDRCKADGGYTEEEIEAAAEQLCRELGITCEWQATRSKESAGLH